MLDFKRIRNEISKWAGRGHWLWVMVKTGITHTMVWGAGTFAGFILGLLVMSVVGVRPMFAYALPLLGSHIGGRFYLDREIFGQKADFWVKISEDILSVDWLKSRLDSTIDIVLPAAINFLALYIIAGIYGLFGL